MWHLSLQVTLLVAVSLSHVRIGEPLGFFTSAFQVTPHERPSSTALAARRSLVGQPLDVHDRREWIGRVSASILGLVSPPLLLGESILSPARAEENTNESPSDLASTLFNPDGSLKEGVESEAKFRTVSIGWPEPSFTDESLTRNDNGVNNPSTPSGSEVQLSYRLPAKWATGSGADELYFDRTEGVNAKACQRITVFRSAGKDIPESRLERASTVGIAQSLGVPSDLELLQTADLVSGRTTTRDGQKYFEFDLAVAPKTCDKSKDDLGLGFCPYDSIYLLSATIVRGRMYVMVIESDKSEWKRANSDLKLVRASFTVQ